MSWKLHILWSCSDDGVKKELNKPAEFCQIRLQDKWTKIQALHILGHLAVWGPFLILSSNIWYTAFSNPDVYTYAQWQQKHEDQQLLVNLLQIRYLGIDTGPTYKI